MIIKILGTFLGLIGITFCALVILGLICIGVMMVLGFIQACKKRDK